MTFDPSSVPIHQGELVYIGDILLKDASVTHRGNYLNYLRRELLPADTPSFDLKIRHNNPTGSRIPILTVRCGKSVSTSLAEILSSTLCGSDKASEIFISRLALGANKTSRIDHERIYSVHREFLNDVTHVVFPLSRPIDSAVTEHHDSGLTTTQTPRQWVKTLVSPDGSSLEVDLENGTNDGHATLIVPSASLPQVQLAVQAYMQRQNPTLAHATKMYSDSMSTHPDIPKSVFTKNIDTLLAKKFSSATSASADDSSATTGPELTPASSLTGAMSQGSSAWKKSLKDTLTQKKTSGAKKAAKSSTELNQLKRIAILEAQLALTNGSDIASAAPSQTSNSSRSHQSQSKASRTSS